MILCGRHFGDSEGGIDTIIIPIAEIKKLRSLA
jgi:hypothetical protein